MSKACILDILCPAPTITQMKLSLRVQNIVKFLVHVYIQYVHIYYIHNGGCGLSPIITLTFNFTSPSNEVSLFLVDPTGKVGQEFAMTGPTGF